MSQALREIPSDSRDYLSLRFGLGQNRRHGLTEISKVLGKGKKHCEILFDRSIRLLRMPRLWKHLSEFVGMADEYMWSAISKEISNAGSIVPNYFGEAFEEKMQRTAGEVELLLLVQYGDLCEWVKTNSLKSPSAWYRSRYAEKNGGRDAILCLGRELDDSKGLLLRESFFEKLNEDEPLLQLTAELSDRDLLFFREFIVEKPLTSILLRGIRLYLLLFYKYKCSTVKIDVLIEEFRKMYSDDKLNEDITKRVLETYPRLVGVFWPSSLGEGLLRFPRIKKTRAKRCREATGCIPALPIRQAVGRHERGRNCFRMLWNTKA